MPSIFEVASYEGFIRAIPKLEGKKFPATFCSALKARFDAMPLYLPDINIQIPGHGRVDRPQTEGVVPENYDQPEYELDVTIDETLNFEAIKVLDLAAAFGCKWAIEIKANLRRSITQAVDDMLQHQNKG